MKLFRHPPLFFTALIVGTLAVVLLVAPLVGNNSSRFAQRNDLITSRDVSAWWERIREANRLLAGSDTQRTSWSQEARTWAQQKAEMSAGVAAAVWAQAASLAHTYGNVSADQAATVTAEMAALADRMGALAHGLDVPALPHSGAVGTPDADWPRQPAMPEMPEEAAEPGVPGTVITDKAADGSGRAAG